MSGLPEELSETLSATDEVLLFKDELLPLLHQVNSRHSDIRAAKIVFFLMLSPLKNSAVQVAEGLRTALKYSLVYPITSLTQRAPWYRAR